MPKAHYNGHNQKKAPPDTERWCFGCKKMTTWHYDKISGHSRCTECGGWFSASQEVPEEAIPVAAKRLMPWIPGSD